MKKLCLILALLTFVIAGCGGKEQAAQEKLQVTASFFPMAEFARHVGGDKVQVTTLVPDGAEAHDWEPSPKDLTRLGRSQVFVYNGIVEPWAEQALVALSERKITGVEAGTGLFARAGKQDPHVWISPKKAITEVARITDAFCTADAKNADYYMKNAAAYVEQLKALDAQLNHLSKTAPRKVFITAHAAFGHLADDYGFKNYAIRGLTAGAEPTPAELQALANLVKRENIRYIFYETLTDPKIAQILAKETGAQVAVLDPLEGLNEEGRKQKLGYVELTQRNIHNLQIALNAQ